MIKQISTIPECDGDWGKVIALTDKGELWALEFRSANSGGLTWVKLPPPPTEPNNQTLPTDGAAKDS